MNLIDNKNIKFFLIPLSIFLIFYYLILMNFAPLWPFNNDTLHKIGRIINNIPIDIINHHSMRWGYNLPIEFLSKFVDINFLTLTFFSFIIFISSGIIFMYVIHTNLGLIYSLLFLIFWLTSKSLNLEIFTLSVNTFSLLVFSIIILYSNKINKNNNYSYLNIVILSVLIFIAYGIKETNLFFFPIFFILLFLQKKYKPLLLIIFLFILFYILESFLINLLSEQNYLFGRIFSLVFHDSNAQSHLNLMKNNEEYNYAINFSTIEGYLIPFYRWYSARDWDTSIFYIAFILSTYFLLNKANTENIIKINSTFLISFFIFTTFFIVSINPLIMGQPFMTRFLTILLPFAFFSLCCGTRILLESSKNKILTLLILSIILLTFLSRPVYSYLKINENFLYLSLNSNYGYSIFERNLDLQKLNQDSIRYDCLLIKINNDEESIRNQIISQLQYIKTNNNFLVNWSRNNKGSILKKEVNKNCKKNIIIKENKIIYQ